MHSHAPVKRLRREIPYEFCVRGEDCNQAAHGNITVIDTCRCGLMRRANVNGNYYESSGWRTSTGETA